MLQIVKADSQQDYQLIEQLADEIWREHYTSIIGINQVEYMLKKFQDLEAIEMQVTNGYQYYLVNYENNAVGYLAYIPKQEVLFLSKIYILKEQRGKGLGTKVMSFLVDTAAELSLPIIELTVNKYNPSVKAYKKIGFVITESVVTDVGEGYVMDDYVMQKNF